MNHQKYQSNKAQKISLYKKKETEILHTTFPKSKRVQFEIKNNSRID